MNKRIFLLVFFGLFLISFCFADSLTDLNLSINLANEIEKPYYIDGISEWISAWNSFVEVRNSSEKLYNKYENIDLNDSDISSIVTKNVELKRSIEIIQGLIDIDNAFVDRNSPKGFQITINEQSLSSSGANRLRAFSDIKHSNIYLLLSETIQSQSMYKGTSGSGLKTAMLNVMMSDSTYQMRSGDSIIDFYNSDGSRKSVSEIQSTAQNLALKWAGTTLLGSLFTSFGVLSGKIKEFTVICRTSDGTIFERKYYFYFIDSNIGTFDSSYNYCYSGKTGVCNEVTFLDWDGKVLDIQSILLNNNAVTFEPQRDRYKFVGWNDSLSGVSSNRVLMANYEELIYYDVLFLDYNGSILSEQSVVAGGSAVKPTDPVRDGYYFTGWDSIANNINQSMNITAQYIESFFVGGVINLTDFLNSSTGIAVLPQINFSNDNFSVKFPASNVSSNLDWDGVMNLPNITTIELSDNEDFDRVESFAIHLGVDNASIFFDRAVQITFINDAGKKIGYVNYLGEFHEINDICGENSQIWSDINLLTNGECYINQGNNLIVWTKHFTNFVSYTQVALSYDSSDESSDETSTRSKKSSSDDGKPTYVCSVWGDCVNGYKTRICKCTDNCRNYVEPITSLVCKSDNLSNKVLRINNYAENYPNTKQKITFDIYLLIFILSFISLLGLFFVLYFKLKNRSRRKIIME